MLRRLSVENYVLIDKLEMELDPHLNIITGETGAGKSILLGALGLLLGAKNDGSAMKDAARNCVVEGTFDLSGRDMEAFFAGNDLDYAPETTVTRMITPAGKSRAFINDLPVQLAQLREFGTRLIDIHSQHQNLILASEEFRNASARIVLLHIPLGNGTWHGNIHLEELFLPILNDADIDVMLSGHTHRYSFHPANDKVRFPVLVNDNASLLKCDVGDGKITARIYGPEGTVTHSHEFPLK